MQDFVRYLTPNSDYIGVTERKWSSMEDQAIIALFLERSEQGIVELISKYGKAVRKITGNILADPLDAEECANDTYLGVWDSIPPTIPKSLGAYCCGIARNKALSRWEFSTAQKRNSHFDAALEELEGTIPALGTVESELEARELAGCISAFLAQLPYDDRYAFLRRYYYADAVADIAETLGKTPHRISVRLFRIRENLKKYLRKEGMLP